MTYPNEAIDLAYAWELAGTPLDEIADMHIRLQYILAEEKEHAVFLSKLLETLHGPGWDKLTIAEANVIRQRHR